MTDGQLQPQSESTSEVESKSPSEEEKKESVYQKKLPQVPNTIRVVYNRKVISASHYSKGMIQEIPNK